MLRHLDLVRTEVSEELVASIIMMTRIGELGTTLAVTSNRRKLRRNTWFTDSWHPDEGGAQILRNVDSYRATRSNFPEDAILHSHCLENLKSYISQIDLKFILTLDLTAKIYLKIEIKIGISYRDFFYFKNV
jgi:hypothetical protein